MPIVIDAEVPDEAFSGGATYKTLVGGQAGQSPVTIGIQTCPPGYRTALHSHPYQEVIMVMAGEGEAWTSEAGETAALQPGVTLVLPAGVKHWFRATGSAPLKIYGIHASPKRIVTVHDR